MKGYSCQCITHVGCCIKRKPRENIKVCVNVLPTSYRQVTDTLPTVGPLSANCRPTVGRLSAHCRPTGSQYFGQNLSALCWPTVGRQTTNCRPTVGRQSADRFFGELLKGLMLFSSMEPQKTSLLENINIAPQWPVKYFHNLTKKFDFNLIISNTN